MQGLPKLVQLADNAAQLRRAGFAGNIQDVLRHYCPQACPPRRRTGPCRGRGGKGEPWLFQSSGIATPHIRLGEPYHTGEGSQWGHLTGVVRICRRSVHTGTHPADITLCASRWRVNVRALCDIAASETQQQRGGLINLFLGALIGTLALACTATSPAPTPAPLPTCTLGRQRTCVDVYTDDFRGVPGACRRQAAGGAPRGSRPQRGSRRAITATLEAPA